MSLLRDACLHLGDQETQDCPPACQISCTTAFKLRYLPAMLCCATELVNILSLSRTDTRFLVSVYPTTRCDQSRVQVQCTAFVSSTKILMEFQWIHNEKCAQSASTVHAGYLSSQRAVDGTGICHLRMQASPRSLMIR
jgi:hypothetical protein